MKSTVKSTVAFGKVSYTDAEITAADGFPPTDANFPDKDTLRQVIAVMSPAYDDVAWVIVNLEGYYRGENEGLLKTGTFAVIELEEDSDGDISWDGSFVRGPTSYETALACAISCARDA